MPLTIALINNQNESPVNLQRYFDAAGCKYRTIDYRALGPTTTLEGFDCVVLSGTGEKTWLEPSPYVEEITLLQRCELPVLGICGGHQILAQASHATLAPLGGPVYGKTRVTQVGPSRLLRDLPETFVVFTKHQYVIDHAPAGYRVTARSESLGCIYAIEHERELKFGVQFHPERRNDGALVLESFLQIARLAKRER